MRPIPEALKTYKDFVDRQALSVEARSLVEMEDIVSIGISKDTSLRLKVIDACGHGCIFCHNEGTLVNQSQAGYRVSVFLPNLGGQIGDSISNQGQFSGFRVESVEADHFLKREIEQAEEILGITKVHLTGGEPTQHPRLSEIVSMLTNIGMVVKMTSNGETGGRIYENLAKSGLASVNVSIFGSTAEEYAATQPPQFGRKWAERKLALSREAIKAARKHGISVKSNCVMTDATHTQRITRLIQRAADEGFNLRVLNDLVNGQKSIIAIYELLAGMDARPIRRELVAGASGTVSYFQLPNGQEIGFKQIRKERLPSACRGCKIDEIGMCEEGYYGVRLYKREGVVSGNPYVMGVCIQRMELALPSEEFYQSVYPQEIRTLRENDYTQLLQYQTRLNNI